MSQLRPYQNLGIDRVARLFAAGTSRILYQLPTGGGKTVLFAGLVKRYLDKQQKRVLILVHREELLQQAYKTLFNWYDIAAAPVTASKTYLPNVMVYVAMVETAYNRLKRNPDYFGNIGLVIIDESHRGEFRKMHQYFKDALTIGFSATPLAASKDEPLKSQFQEIVTGPQIRELIEMGSLLPNKTYHVQNIDRKELKVTGGDFNEGQMGRVYSGAKHVQNTLAAYLQHSKGTKAIIFNCNIEHSKKVTEAFRAYGLPVRHLDGTMDDKQRKEVFAWFHHTQDGVLCNVDIATTGFDEPSIETVIVNRATMSLPLWLQMTGRGSRTFPGLSGFNIIDMGGNALCHGDWSDDRDWRELFVNPEKARDKKGDAPVKECVQCGFIMHLSAITCKECGAENRKRQRYDEGPVRYELLSTDRPIQVDVPGIISDFATKKKADGSAYHEFAAVHEIKRQIIFHAQKRWRLRTIDEKTAVRLLEYFRTCVKAWCEQKGKKWSTWWEKSTREWMDAEYERAFKFKPQSSSKPTI
jgi:superfamily II DNA or RNA helicase